MHEAAGDTTEVFRPYIAPFSDESGFREGIFELDYDIPRMLTEQMGKQSLWRMVPFQAVLDAVARTPQNTDDQAFAVGELLKADFVGRISGGGQPGTSIAADDRLQFIEPPE